MPSAGGLILYAKWVDITYSVTYNLNGGTGATAPTDADTYTVGQDVTAAAAPAGLAAPADKRFDGWNTRADGSG
ncbi:InlB B-repeat-containing protein, partial [Olavius algarvensis spirochete endosymbiont]|uniref:InlB B-repeat-containing protein n=1 Tax=Olavius algarvensis spirochete endosymbiont TaxID=260710 RepID=UPI001E5A0654